MIATMLWKEVREHSGIWITMIFMTVIMGSGLSKILAWGNPFLANSVAALTILGMAATYGVVCGAMMFAGEHEGGTLIFLDIFSGRRGALWMAKAAIGAGLAATEALMVAVILYSLQQEPPSWGAAFAGLPVRLFDPIRAAARPEPALWFAFLPVVTLEAYVWGLFGSALTRRVLVGAAFAACGLAPIWTVAMCAPPEAFLPIRLIFMIAALATSYGVFLGQSKDASPGAAAPEPVPLPLPNRPRTSKEKFLDLWEEFERKDPLTRAWAATAEPKVEPPPLATNPESAGDIPEVELDDPIDISRPMRPSMRADRTPQGEAKSPNEVLRWLILEQAWQPAWILAIICIFVGLFIPANSQLLWPIATLLVGVACGVAAFAPEQRDLSYQFLASQHLPLHTVWRYKLGIWFGLAVLDSLILAFASAAAVTVGRLAVRGERPHDWMAGALRDNIGSVLFFGVWLVYGFCVGQIIVWLCRKNILAVLVSVLVALGAIAIWLPSLLCGGMSGWQLWLPPMILLAATWSLMRAWTGGRIQERRPLMALGGFVAAILAWSLINDAYRAWEVPNAEPPMDPIAFRDNLPTHKDNIAGREIQKSLAEFGHGKPLGPRGRRLPDEVLTPLDEALRAPVGVLEQPRSEGQPTLTHLPACKKLVGSLLNIGWLEDLDEKTDSIDRTLLLSRNLCNKAPFESYLDGVSAQNDTLNAFDQWLNGGPFNNRAKPETKAFRRILDILNRHAAETPPPIDCLHTECYRSAGVLNVPSSWNDLTRGGRRDWLVGAVSLSMETPWEAERKSRLWRLVWAGLFRGSETPYWELPSAVADPPHARLSTRSVLRAWIPASDGSGISRERMFALLDSSWVPDNRLFCPADQLRSEAIRARCKLDLSRLAVALSLRRLTDGKLPDRLDDLAPLFPAGVPQDPYSGRPFGYRVDDAKYQLWSTGPDRVDNGGANDGGHLPDDELLRVGGFDFVKNER